MRTLELSEPDARRLVEMLAGKWAHRVTNLAGADVRIDNPLRDERGSKRRAYEVEAAFLARLLVGLGVELPEIRPDAHIVIPIRVVGRTTVDGFDRSNSIAEATRLRSVILDQLREVAL